METISSSAEAERVVLVDEDDREVGTADKLGAHVRPALHRAVSVVVCDGRGRLLMQRRSFAKYHSPGLWSNTCCGHPRPGETAAAAASRRLLEEMGIRCELRPACVLTYRLDLGQGLHEHELNRVFVGLFDGTPDPSADEVAEWAWVDSRDLDELRRHRTATLTAWFEPVVAELQRWAAATDSAPTGIRQAILSWR